MLQSGDDLDMDNRTAIKKLIIMANDNITADTPHHAECLRLIKDIHDLFRCAQAADRRFVGADDDTAFAYDWAYWADECARLLKILPHP